MEFGKNIATNSAYIPEELYQRVAANYTEIEMVNIISFGAMMTFNNIFNNAADVDLDDYLQAYRLAATQA